MANLLQLLGLAGAPVIGGTSAQQIRPIQSIDPNTGLPVSGPIINGVIPPDAPPPQQPEIPAASGAPINLLEGTPYDQSNVLQAIGGSPDAPQPAPVPQAPQQSAAPAEAPRQRRSLLDTVGRISDVLARVGGAEALYQPTLDAREDRANALADRQRGIDLDALRRTLVEQQIAAGDTSAEAGAQDRGQQHLAMAVRGLQAIQRAGGDVNVAAPLIFQRAGVSPEDAQQISQAISGNPNALEGLASMFNTTENGMQVVDLGDRSVIVDRTTGRITGELARGERPGDAENRAIRRQVAQIGADGRLRVAQIGADSRERVAEIRGPSGGGRGAQSPQTLVNLANTAQPIIDQLREAATSLYQSGGMTGPNSTTLGTLNTLARENIPGYERLTSPQGRTARADLERLRTTGLSTLLPLLGGLTLGGRNLDAAKELDTWRNAILSAQDYPSAMHAIDQLQARINQIVRENENGGAAPSQPRRTIQPRRIIRPNSSRGAVRSSRAPTVSGW